MPSSVHWTTSVSPCSVLLVYLNVFPASVQSLCWSILSGPPLFFYRVYRQSYPNLNSPSSSLKISNKPHYKTVSPQLLPDSAFVQKYSKQSCLLFRDTYVLNFDSTLPPFSISRTSVLLYIDTAKVCVYGSLGRLGPLQTALENRGGGWESG